MLALQLATPHWPDSAYLARRADSAGVQVELVLAIVWQESRASLDPKLRGKHCWHSTITTPDGTVAPAYHSADCEVGRAQIKPSTAKAWGCTDAGMDVFTYRGNIDCLIKHLHEVIPTIGAVMAAERHNGRGPLARAYRDKILMTVGWLTLTKGDKWSQLARR